MFFHFSSPFAVLIDFISMTRIWVQLLFNIRWLIYYLWWSIANRNSHFSFLHHMSEANASYLEWNGKCFITKLLHLKRLHFYEARLSAYEAFCGNAAKYEAPQMRYEAKPFQASCFFALKSRQKKMAERARFELAEACTSAVFKTAALNHSTISPSKNIPIIYLFPAKLQVIFYFFSWKKGSGEPFFSFLNEKIT